MVDELLDTQKSFDRLQMVLSQIQHFKELSPETQKAIQRAASPRHFRAGQVIYIQGEPADFVYILEIGWVKATRMTHDGREQALLFLRPVDIFGDIAVLTGTTYPGTVVALEDVYVWVIPAKTVIDLTWRHHDLAMAVIRHMGERVIHYINLVEDLSLRSVEARIAKTLLQNVILQNGELVVPRRNWTTFDAMAIRLGTVRDVLSRTLKTLEDENLLRVEKHGITVLDPKGLAERANC